jgi:hypothetical protein
MSKLTAKKLRSRIKRYGIKKERAGDSTLVPIGNNKLGAKDLFIQRGLYATTSYPDFAPTPIDTYHKYNNLYGRVDSDMNPIFLAEDNLKQLPMGPSGETLFALGFVSEAFKDLQKYFKNAVATGRLSIDDTAYPMPEAILAWSTEAGLHNTYNSYWESLYSLFVGKYLDSHLNQKINNFDDFMKVFLGFSTKLAFTKPVTRVAFITSNYLDPRATGLVIDMREGDHGDDYAKYVGFIRDQNFSFFARACERFGFYVNKNAPWRIHADITNPYMQEKLKQFGMESEDDFFTTYYLKASNYEMDNLKIRFFQLYDLFLKQYPDVTSLSPKVGPEVAASFVPGRKIDGGIKTIITYKRREPMTFEGLNRKYSDEYWMRLYVYLRAVETHKPYTQTDFDRSVRTACEYMNYVGMWRAIEYTDKVYRHTDAELYEQRTNPLYEKTLKKDLTGEDGCAILTSNINEVRSTRPNFYF